MPTKSKPEYISVSQAATEAGVSVGWISELIRRGVIEAHKPVPAANLWLVDRASFLKWKASPRQAGRPKG